VIKLLLLALKSKALFTVGTMLLSVIVYSFFFGWLYAVGVVALWLVHEMGHYVAARQRGLDPGLPTFIPFVGAWVKMDKIPHSVETTAYVAMAGPLAGSVAALFCFFVARQTGSGLWLALAYFGFLLNLINMAPAGMLDGGKITGAVSPRLWLIGSPLMVALFFVIPNPMLLLVALFSWPYFVAGIKGVPPDAEYFQVPMATRINYGVAYLGLLVFLGAMTYSLHETLQATYHR
jgi:Zn-dependent protease